MRPWLLVVAALAATGVVAAGCGSVDRADGSASADGTPATAGPLEDDEPPDTTPGVDAADGADPGPDQGPDSTGDGGPDGPGDEPAQAGETPDDQADTGDQGGAGDDGSDGDGPTDGEGGAADGLAPVGPGDRGDDVVALQARLAELGFAPGPPDGDYGRRTEAAVGIFQEIVDLRPSGEADRPTMQALATYRYDGLRLAAGDEGEQVEELQQRLTDGPFDPGPIDGQYGTATTAAVWALEKLAGVPVDGDWGPVDELAWQRLTDGEVGRPEKDHDRRWVEVDLSEQLVKVYEPGTTAPILVSHASSGSGIPWQNEDHRGSSVTPLGDFAITRRIDGWRESSLDIGRLYNPLYFNGGIALHGSLSVPLYPASHGCIRLPMHVADYLPAELPDGTPVHVLA